MLLSLLSGSRVNKGKARAEAAAPRPSSLASVVAACSSLALLLSASQEVDRGSAYRIGHPAYRSRGGCFEHEDFELLHPRYRSAGSLRYPLADGDDPLVGGIQRLLALPEGHALQLPALAAGEGYHPLESFHLTQSRQDLLADVSRGVVDPVRGYLQRSHASVHTVTPSSRLPKAGLLRLLLLLPTFCLPPRGGGLNIY